MDKEFIKLQKYTIDLLLKILEVQEDTIRMLKEELL